MRRPALRSSCLLALAFLSFPVLAQSSVSYGRITAVNLVTEQNRQAQTVGALARRKLHDLYPEEHKKEIDWLNERIYRTVNNGVYRAGFATAPARVF